MPRPPFCFVVTAVVPQAAAARGAAKGTVQWEFVMRAILLQKVCRIPKKLFCEVLKLMQKATMEFLWRWATEIVQEVFETGRAIQEEETMAEAL